MGLCLSMFAQNTKQVYVSAQMSRVCLRLCVRVQSGSRSVAVISVVIYSCVSQDALAGP